MALSYNKQITTFYILLYQDYHKLITLQYSFSHITKLLKLVNCNTQNYYNISTRKYIKLTLISDYKNVYLFVPHDCVHRNLRNTTV